MSRIVLVAMVVSLTACGHLLSVEDSLPADTDGGGGSSSPLASASPSHDGGSSAVGEAGADAEASTAPSPYAFVPSVKSPSFTDNFSRADGAIGNGWFEKTVGSFTLDAGGVQQLLTTSAGYPNLLLLRPELSSDVELSATLKIGSDAADWHMLIARAQSSSDVSGRILAYALCVNAGGIGVGIYSVEASSQRGPGGSAAVASPSLVVSRAYRVTFRVKGTDPVVLEAGLFDGTKVIASVRWDDETPYRITSAGRAGLGGGSIGTRWDDFERVDL